MKTPSLKRLLMVFVPAIAVLMVLAAASVLYQVSIPGLTSDIAAIAGVHPLAGALSNLGILLWCAAGATCAFAAMILRSLGARENYRFLLSSASLSAYLMFDDLFLFHEVLAKQYLGLSQDIIFILLGIAISAYMVIFRKTILQTNVIVLLLAFVFLFLSVVVDSIIAPWSRRLGDWEYFIEDGAKWLGIVFWCSYYLESSFQFVVRVSGMPDNTVQSDTRASRS